MKLYLNSLEVNCILGDLPFEREVSRSIIVDVELDIPDAAAKSDDLSDTVDYAALTAEITRVLTNAKCRLIERAAFLVAETCVKFSPVRSATARVTKPGAIEHLKSATAEYTLDRCF